MVWCIDQDTLVALSALSRLAKKTFTKTLEKDIVFSLPNLTVPHTVTADNRFEVKTVEVRMSVFVYVSYRVI